MDAKTKMATEFMNLFEGMRSVHGVYKLPATVTAAGEKVKGRAFLEHRPYTLAHWIEHLTGAKGIGICPINESNQCRFAAIDIDVYDLPEEAIKDFMDRLKPTPLVPCRTKSGGYHVYVFFEDYAAAGEVRKGLKRIAKQLGFGGAEIYPKQAEVDVKGDNKGSWLNMPYFAGSRTERYAIDPATGQRLNPAEFLLYAEDHKVPASMAADLSLKRIHTDETMIPDGPPCLQTLTARGFPKGSMNNALLALATYYKKANPDDWEKKVEEANTRWMKPGSAQEVAAVIRSLRKKDYQYKCNEEPLCSHCDRDTCVTRKFGVGLNSEAEMPEITGLIKITTDPPQYYISVAGQKVGPLGSEDLLMQGRFQRKVFEKIGLVTPGLKPARWRAILNELHQTVTLVEAPDDSSAEGRLIALLEDFVSRFRTEVKDEVVIGRAFMEGGTYQFRGKDFFKYLEQSRFSEYKSNQIAAIFRQKLNMTIQGIKVRGKHIKLWSVSGLDVIESIDGHKTQGAPY